MSATIALVSAIVVIASGCFVMAANPIPPVLSATFEKHWTQLIPPETTANRCVTAQKGKMMSERCSTVEGTAGTIFRFDVGKKFIFYTHNNKPVCVVSSLPVLTADLPAPNYAAMSYHATMQMPDGSDAHVFRYPIGRYFQAIFVNTVTNLVSALYTGEMNNVHALMSNYTDGAASDRLFDVTLVGCNLSSSSELQHHTPAAAAATTIMHRGDGDAGLLHPVSEAGRQHSAGAHAAFKKSPAVQKQMQRDAVALSVVDDNIPPPPSADFRKFFCPVRDQGTCGCCWAFSTASLAEAFENRRNGREWIDNYSFSLAPQTLIDCIYIENPAPQDIPPRGCFAGAPLDSLGWVAQNGLPLENQYPFLGYMGSRCRLNDTGMQKVFPFESTYLILNNITAMKLAIARYGGLLSVIQSSVSFNYFGGHGIYDDATCTPGFDHIITIVGYGTDPASGKDYWLVRNTYGLAYSDAGYIRMVMGKNMCGIESYTFAAVPRDLPPMTWSIAPTAAPMATTTPAPASRSAADCDSKTRAAVIASCGALGGLLLCIAVCMFLKKKRGGDGDEYRSSTQFEVQQSEMPH